MIGREKERVDTKSMIVHACMTGKTTVIGHKKATHPNKMVKDKKIYAKSNKFTAKKP